MRAWYKANNEVYDVEKIDFVNEYVWGGGRMFRMCDVELLQSVGRKDSNGTDMFAGDTVSFFVVRGSRPIGTTRLKSTRLKSTGSINWDDDDCCFYIDSDDNEYPWVAMWNANDIVVTGSIFL